MPNSGDYTVGWVCAISTEYVAARVCLDEIHEFPEWISPVDTNDYTLGKIGIHNVVVAALAPGEYGSASIANLVASILRSFPNIRFVLSVGIGGGAPSDKHDIRLGDIVVNSLDDASGGVLQYDFGKIQDGRDYPFTTKLATLQPPPSILRSAVARFNALYETEGSRLKESIEDIITQHPRLGRTYKRPKPDTDKLYKAKITSGPSSSDDDSNRTLILRPERTQPERSPAIHYGRIASSNAVMKDALLRDRLASSWDVLAFEMEAAELIMTDLPFLVIRGISDYSDSHKTSEWQGYAAIAAAAYAKEILHYARPIEAFSVEDVSNDSQNTLRNGDSDPVLLLPASINPKAGLFTLRPCYIIYIGMLLIMLGSGALALYYTICLDKMGDGFTAASWIVAIGAMALAGPLARHYPHCTCWNRGMPYHEGLSRVNTLPP